MKEALSLFHDHKHIFITLGIRDHFNILKFHSLLHYVECIKLYSTTDNYNTKAFEHLHIDLAKEGWRASNTRNALPQMTKWLERQEKIEMFGQYVGHSLEEEEGNNLLTWTVRIILAKHPTVHSQSICSIKVLHSAQYFSRDLKRFLNSLLPPGQAISRVQLQYLDLGLGLECFDVDGKEGKETIKAKLRDTGRFDTIVVTHSAAAESTSLQGGTSYLSYLIFLILSGS